MNKIEILNKLIHFSAPLEQIKTEIQQIGWGNVPVVTLTKDTLKGVIHKYLKNLLSEEDLVEWANLIECREDICFEEGEEKYIQEIIFQISNPELSDTPLKNYLKNVSEEQILKAVDDFKFVDGRK